MAPRIPIRYKYILNISIWYKDGVLTYTATSGQIEPGTNGIEIEVDHYHKP